jgi:hypothetical protein
MLPKPRVTALKQPTLKSEISDFHSGEKCRSGITYCEAREVKLTLPAG